MMNVLESCEFQYQNGIKIELFKRKKYICKSRHPKRLKPHRLVQTSIDLDALVLSNYRSLVSGDATGGVIEVLELARGSGCVNKNDEGFFFFLSCETFYKLVLCLFMFVPCCDVINLHVVIHRLLLRIFIHTHHGIIGI